MPQARATEATPDRCGESLRQRRSHLDLSSSAAAGRRARCRFVVDCLEQFRRREAAAETAKDGEVAVDRPRRAADTLQDLRDLQAGVADRIAVEGQFAVRIVEDEASEQRLRVDPGDQF
ncbi:hypothetical protein [Candidatus Amarobacter glycogenicus]|uniref:hypothetical protein n=1 Tax=Candidatus Amarobacter glycogenicus TaxID=3140699 RepID=UPI002A0E1D84|nr:hypothetical protein [Dehalococcoidia bacterium]